MRRLLVKIGAWLAILLGLAMMLQPTAADWLTRQRNSKTAQQFAANTATAADAANTDSASQTAEESRPYPELYAAQLAANTAMRSAVKTAVESGLPTVAECGGFLYLGQTLEDADGKTYPMAGVLPGQGVKIGHLVRFGYAALTSNADSMLFAAGETLPIHEFHHWDSTANGTDFTAVKTNGRSWACGFANAHLYAGFPHLYWAGTPLPQRFVTAAYRYIKEEP